MSTPDLPIADTLRPDELIGQRLDGYEVVARIGEGGMGVVYGGIHPTIRKKVAIKVLRPEFARDTEQMMRLTQEAQAVNSIGHQHIIDIFGHGSLPDGRHYIVMEYLEGQSLEALLKLKGALPWDQAAQLLIDICRPLQAAHQAGVIHRDLKPSNVFLVQERDGGRYLKLLDFGLAKVTQSAFSSAAQSNQLQVSGTPAYMAPEQARAMPVSAATDLYALGVMAYELVAGRVPFTAAAPMDVIMAHVTTPPPAVSSLAPELPPDFAALIGQLLSKEPADRPESAEAVRRRLDALLGNELTHPGSRSAVVGTEAVALGGSRAQTSRHATLPVGTRSRVGALAAAGALAALALTGAGWLLTRGQGRPEPVAPPPPPVVVEPLPPPVAPDPVVAVEPTPAPVAVPPVEVPPTPAMSDRQLKPPEPTPGRPLPGRQQLTSAQLVQRVDLLERRLQSSTGDGEEPDSSAAALLKKYRFLALSAKTPRQLTDLKASLDKFEARFVRLR